MTGGCGPEMLASVMRLELGKPIVCTDGAVGELADVVVDPVRRRVTHLVVQPHGNLGPARLVPADLASGDGKRISLRCTRAEVDRFTAIRESAYVRTGTLPRDDPDWDVGVEDVLAMPYSTSPDIGVYASLEEPYMLTYDRIPRGEAEIRRASAVVSADDQHLGTVEALVVDREQITHFVLERGHLWGRRDVTIPIGVVAKVESDIVTLRISKDEVGDLPAVRVHRWSP
jgi:sporulation protein YlmC with PRC-barrel domain